MIEAGLVRIASNFWGAAGDVRTAPRDPAAVVSRLLPLSIVQLSGLSIKVIEQWFAARRAPYSFLCHNRALCGCLVAAGGHGFVFVDSQDAADERRFTLAHEIAHFLLDYDAPRRRALELFGESIRPVLDGLRPPTVEERIHSVLSSTPIGMFYNLMPRGEYGGVDQGSTLVAEDRADRLALELLAPADEVLADLPAQGMQSFERARYLSDMLVDDYGLPRAVARTYAAALLPQSTQISTAQWFGL
jgi:hypothetical protein